jgi:membrane-associated phospholipid phosphatase
VAIGLLWAEGWPDRSAERFIDDALPILEATFALAAITQVVKFAVGRERPFAYHSPPERPFEDDDFLSFYSGHTGTTFAIATSAGTVARMRGYRLEPVIWAAGLTIATTTGYLRIAGDKHWFSDVVVGAAVGSAIGLTLPRLLHGRHLTVAPVRDGVVLSGAF